MARRRTTDTAARAGRTRRDHLALAGAALGGLGVAACGGAAGPEAAKPQTGPVTIDVLTYSGLASPTGRAQWYAKTTPQNFTPQTQITVNWIEGTPSLPEKIISMSAAGTPPDVGHFVGTDGRALAAKSLYRPLDELIKRDKFDRAAYWKSAIDQLTVNGKLYGIPNHGNFGENVVYANLNMARRAGLDLPLATGEWTVEQMVEMARKATHPELGEWGWWPNITAEGIKVNVRLFGGDVLSPDGRRCVLDGPEGRAALQWLSDAQHKFQTIDDLNKANGASRGNDGFLGGKLLFCQWTTGGAAEWKIPGRLTFDLGITLFPKGPNGRRASVLITHGTAVTGTAKVDAAWKWVQFITNRENGVLQVLAGAGSPGARPDVWEDKRLADHDPIFGLSQRTYKDPAPDHLTWNHTCGEVWTATSDRLKELWSNRVGVNEAAAATAREVNEILQRPPAG
jgi:multiple sugar transport system substrate-binding protein